MNNLSLKAATPAGQWPTVEASMVELQGWMETPSTLGATFIRPSNGGNVRAVN
jgi:hypothetical protein